MSWNEAVIEQFRAGKPRVADMFDLTALLLLHTTGARSGAERIAPLAFVTIDDTMVVVASAAGAPKNPDWFANIVAEPEVTVERWQDGQHVTTAMTAAVPTPEERDSLWPRVTRLAPGFADYQTKTTRTIPLVRLLPR